MAEGSEIAVIGYHINDDFANIYSNARAEYYNMFGLPHVMVDGTQSFEWNYDDLLEKYEDRISVASNYSISIEVDRYATDVSATINIGQLGASNPETKVLHLLLTESHIPKSWYGGDEVNHALRLMSPDENGTLIESGKNTLSSFDFEFEMDPSWLVQNCELVAFIQDTVSKEIMQTQVFLMESTVLYNDVALTDILEPDNNYCKENISPAIRLENYGADVLSSCLITYSINGEEFEFNWEGVLYTYQSEIVILPEVDFVLEESNSIIVELSLPNGLEDENQDDNTFEKSFGISQIIETQNLVLELKTDYSASETSWELINSIGNIVYSGDGYVDSTLYNIDLEYLADDCYTFMIYDAGGNGICCDNGFGYYRIKDADGLIYFIGGGFGELDVSSFQIDIETNIKDKFSEVRCSIFPNPSSEFAQIKSEALIYEVIISDTKGYLVKEDSDINSKNYTLDLNSLQYGIYIIQVVTEKGSIITKLIKL